MYKLLYCLQEIQRNCQSIFTENNKDTYITFTKQCKVYDKIEWTLLSALKDMALFTTHLMCCKMFQSPLHNK